MTPQELKNSILQLAIQGKLVEQRPEEGTADELYAQIQAEKQKLIRAGKIKKEKPLPEITEDEIPFEIPESWKWVRMSSIISLLSGADLVSDKYNSLHNGIPYITGASNIEKGSVIINRWTEFPNNIAHKGDLLLTCKGTVGKTAILTENEVHIARQIMAITAIEVDIVYIQRFIEIQVNILKSKAKSMIPGIERSSVLNLAFPIPPLAEQKRIVAKIEELLPYIDRYAEAWSRLEEFNKRFPEDMQKSILQMAIQGKLVEQRPEEGTAEELYEQIQKEKQKLIKAGKIKKEKPLPEITEDEIPFEIPESWKWVRLGNTVSVRGGKRMPAGTKLTTTPNKHIYIRVTDMQGGTIMDNDLHYVPESIYPKIKQYIITSDDVYIVIVGSTIGKSGLVPKRFDGMNLTENAARLIPVLICKEYLYYLLNTVEIQNQFMDKTKQVGQPKLAIFRLQSTLLPIPPVEEQKRIVTMIEELLPYCARLKN